MSLYDLLGVPSDADLDAINAAYRRKAREQHPDAGGDADAFAALGAAVGVLRDPERRRRYDATGETSAAEDSTQGGAIQLLVEAFQSVMARTHDTFRHVDVIAASDGVLAESLQHLAGEREAARVVERRVADALARLGHAGNGPDVIRGVLESQARQVAGMLEGFDLRERLTREARELLKAYAWRVDPQPAQSGTFGLEQLQRASSSANAQRGYGFGSFFR